MTMTSKRSPYGRVSESVEIWISEQPAGTEFHYGELADMLGLLKPSVSGVLSRMVRQTGHRSPIEIGGKAGWYRVLPEPIQEAPRDPGAGSAMEIIGELRDGSAMLRDKNGDFWKAARI